VGSVRVGMRAHAQGTTSLQNLFNFWACCDIISFLTKCCLTPNIGFSGFLQLIFVPCQACCDFCALYILYETGCCNFYVK
jgi:hypothetical protein